MVEQIDHDEHGTPLLKGTDIEVHRIAALLTAGVSVDSVLEDDPSLTADQVRSTEAYATAHPDSGRPYPKITAKAAMRAADLSALDNDN